MLRKKRGRNAEKLLGKDLSSEGANVQDKRKRRTLDGTGRRSRMEGAGARKVREARERQLIGANVAN